MVVHDAVQPDSATEGLALQANGLTKIYAGVRALDGVSFDVRPGEVHCLVGENGAGKSTLIKILTGAVRQDAGTIVLGGEDVSAASVRERQTAGISVIYQDLNLVPHLTVTENIFLGHELRTPQGTLDKKRMREEASRLVESFGVEIPVDARVGELGISLQQLTATARALSLNGRILIMDEPSAVLVGRELEVLFSVMRRLKEQGIGLIYISHRLEEIFHVGDRVTVLRDGAHIRTCDVSEVDHAELIRLMVGREVEAYVNASLGEQIGPEVLRLEHLTRRGVLDDISLSVHAGEVLGIAGLVGAGRTELARAIVGLDRIDSGTLYLEDKPRKVRSVTQALKLGIAIVPEDRRAEGIVPMLSVRDNAALSVVSRNSTAGFINYRRMYELVGGFLQEFAVKARDLRDPISGLSGGNQQKVVLAKCLAAHPKLLILDEPTVGIDVGAKKEIYALISRLKEQGLAVIVISAELPEILALSDRILIMAAGRIAGEADPRVATQEELLELAIPPMLRIAEEAAA